MLFRNGFVLSYFDIFIENRVELSVTTLLENIKIDLTLFQKI